MKKLLSIQKRLAEAEAAMAEEEAMNAEATADAEAAMAEEDAMNAEATADAKRPWLKKKLWLRLLKSLWEEDAAATDGPTLTIWADETRAPVLETPLSNSRPITVSPWLLSRLPNVTSNSILLPPLVKAGHHVGCPRPPRRLCREWSGCAN